MIADRLIMKPTRHRLSTLGKQRETIPFRKGDLEVWTQCVGANDTDEVDLFVLKFHGTAGAPNVRRTTRWTTGRTYEPNFGRSILPDTVAVAEQPAYGHSRPPPKRRTWNWRDVPTGDQLSLWAIAWGPLPPSTWPRIFRSPA